MNIFFAQYLYYNFANNEIPNIKSIYRFIAESANPSERCKGKNRGNSARKKILAQFRGSSPCIAYTGEKVNERVYRKQDTAI